jgi:hypothetical protein
MPFLPICLTASVVHHEDGENNSNSVRESRCKSASRLDCNPREKIEEAFNRVGNYRPVSRAKLEQENNALYLPLEKERELAVHDNNKSCEAISLFGLTHPITGYINLICSIQRNNDGILYTRGYVARTK